MVNSFNSSPMAVREERRDRRRFWVLGSSVLLHAAVFGTLAGVQAWRVEAVAEPPANDVFQVLLPAQLPAESAPPAAGRQRRQRSEPVRKAATVPQQVANPSLVQPRAADIPLPPKAHEPQAAAEIDRQALDPTDEKKGDRGPSSGDDGSDRSVDNGSNGDFGSHFDRGAPGGGDGRPLPIGGPISRPQIVPGTKIQPVYTELARQAHLQGSVILQATIDEGGNVIDLRVLEALPMGLDREAVRAVSQWKFTPALLYGRPVKVFFTVTVQYEAR
jgi:TonB family protein